MIDVLVVKGNFSTIQTREKVKKPGASPGSAVSESLGNEDSDPFINPLADIRKDGVFFSFVQDLVEKPVVDLNFPVF